MTEIIRKKLNDNPVARWGVLAIVSITMMCGYFITDVMAPLQTMLEENFGWSGTEYGLFTGAYGWFNVFLFILIVGGVILDKKGMRFTGILACFLMIVGCTVKYYAVSPFFSHEGYVFGMRTQVLLACAGFATFGAGVEIAGITVTKIIARWFKGKEIALAMGLQVATARIGTSLAFALSVPLAKKFNEISAPVLFGLAILCIGLLSFIVFCVMDRKLDESIRGTNSAPEESFRLKDIRQMIRIKGFWLIAVLCVLFYSAVFPFLKYATSLMINKYGIPEDWAGYIPSLISLGAIVLTPIFGSLYDRTGKGASIMYLGAFLIIVVHVLFALPVLNVWWFAAAVMVILGIAFSLVPSAMWPSVPKIIPQHMLGSAYATIFWVQNIGLAGVPTLIGWVLAKYCMTGNPDTPYDYTLPMIIFASFGVAAAFVAFLLKKEDKKKGYGLELPNIEQKKAQ
ncbi:MAG: MFS transporter [Tannerella sp.]|jgi:MFS family permease|nr:MFS transporter [Tannerella sp.]